MTAYDVAVVGAGIAGCAVAMACAQRAARVALLDRGQPGAGASGAAAGLLAPGGETDQPGAFFDAARASLALWPELAAAATEASGIDCGLSIDGLLRLAQDAAEVAALERRLAWQQAAGVAVEWLDETAVLATEPACAAAPWGAAWYPGEGHVDSPASVRALATGAERLGATLLAGAEVAGATPGGGLRLAGGAHLEAAVVVIAAGAWSGSVAATMGLPAPPLRPLRGQLIVLKGVGRLPDRVLYAGRLGYAVAGRDGFLLVGATEEDAGYEVAVTAAATEELLTTARTLVTGAAAAILHGARVGLRPAAPDRLPLLGELGNLGDTRVLIASGHHRNGVLLAPVTATGMAGLALEGTLPAGW
ncbi:MAG TPA: FAD-dependent oxidoreductase, partial [Candidatus Dormibacteraeota bacterium]